MKKFIAVSMIALLAVTSVFAGFSGSVSTEAGWWIDDEEYGFKNNDAEFELTFAADTVNGGVKGDADVYAEMAGSVAFSGKLTGDAPYVLDAEFSLDKFAVVGNNWSVDLTGAAGIGNNASDWFKGADKKVANAPTVTTEGAGVTATVYDYTVGLGFFGKKEGVSAALTVATPEYKLADGLTLSANAGAGKKAAGGFVDFGGGLTVAYAQEEGLSAKVASDVVLAIPTSDSNKFGWDLDVAASVAYAPVTFNAYYATNAKEGYAAESTAKNYYSVGLAADLNSLDVPVTLGVNVLNVQEKSGKITANVGTAVAGVTASVNGGYDFGTEKWNLGAKAGYTFEGIGALSAGFDLKDNAEVLSTSVGFETTTLLAGAKLGLAWNTTDLLADKLDDVKWGSVVASIACEF